MEQLRLYSFLKSLKRAPENAMTVHTSEGDVYRFRYVKDERLWRVEQNLSTCNDAIGLSPLIEMKRNVSKLVSRIGHVVQVVIREETALT